MRLMAWSVLLLAVLGAGRVYAQQPSDSERTLGREEYKKGVAAARQGQWKEARESFARAYELVGLPPMLYNLAGAQAKTGRLVEAAESYRRFLREGQGEQSKPLREDAKKYLEELEQRIPKLQIRAPAGLQHSDRLAVDGEKVAHAVLDRGFPVNPGTHQVTVRRAGEVVARAEVTVDEGAQRRVELDVPEPDQPSAPGPAEAAREGLNEGEGASEPGGPKTAGGAEGGGGASEPDDGGIVTSPWLWIAVGAAVAGGVVTAVMLTRPDGKMPYQGNLDPIDFR